jgi:hypothetical protein
LPVFDRKKITKGRRYELSPFEKGDRGGFYSDSFIFLAFEIHFSKG